MARNVEIKARCQDHGVIRDRLTKMGAKFSQSFDQCDTFFRVPKGRLKLRQQEGRGELIFYLRPDQDGPKTSKYWRLNLVFPRFWKGFLSILPGRIGQILKTRELWMLDQTRFHLDLVQGLGTFLEFEIVMQDSDALEDAQILANAFLLKLNLQASDMCSHAYIDMLK